MLTIDDLPTLNAILNACATVLLIVGWTLVKRGRLEAHRNVMITAFAVSTVFLVSYLVHKAFREDRPFPTEYPTWRTIYLFVILLPHVVLAAVNVPLILTTIILAWKGRIERHKKLARFTIVSWLYVSVTGVLIYFFLYHWFVV